MAPERAAVADRSLRMAPSSVVVRKTILEWPVALVAAVVLLPLMAALAALVRLSGPGPVLHRRRVLGRGGLPFDAFKFRTMVADADVILERDAALQQAFAARAKLADDPRVTPLGRILRRFSLDELPQLFNVLRGDMALVGPRMISPAEADRYGSKVDCLLSVKPGVTGLWQVSGRQTTSYGQRVALDMRYIAEWSPWMDLLILLRTLPAVLRGVGAH